MRMAQYLFECTHFMRTYFVWMRKDRWAIKRGAEQIKDESIALDQHKLLERVKRKMFAGGADCACEWRSWPR